MLDIFRICEYDEKGVKGRIALTTTYYISGNSSGQGGSPYRRYSPRPAQRLIWCDSKTDSKVWMREEDNRTEFGTENAIVFFVSVFDLRIQASALYRFRYRVFEFTGIFFEMTYGFKKLRFFSARCPVQNDSCKKERTVMNEKTMFPVKNLVFIAMLGALSFVIMLVEFPLPFIAPAVYELDFSEVPALIGSFAMGPVAGIFIELIKILIKLLFKPTSTAYVGELANFLIGCAIIVPAGFIYKYNRTKKGAVIGMICGVATMIAAGCVINAFVLLPWYANAFGGMDTIIKLGTEVHAGVTDLFTFVVLTVAPFNLIKGILVSILTFLLYKRVAGIIKKF